MPTESAKTLLDLFRSPEKVQQMLALMQRMEKLRIIREDGTTVPIRFSETDAVFDFKTPEAGPPATILDPETIVWRDRATAAGGTFGADSVEIADELIKAIKAESFNSKIVYLLPFLGANLATARVPLRDTLGVGIASNSNFVDADFSESTGLQGNGTTKYLNSLITPTQLGTTDNGGLGWWERDFTGTGNSEPMGAYKASTSPDERFCLDLRPAQEAFHWGAIAGGAASGAAAGNKHYYGQRSGASNRELFIDGASAGTDTDTPTVDGSGDLTIKVCGSHVGTAGGVLPWPGLGAVAYMTDGTLTAGEVATLHTLLTTYLITPTGR
jgi:hypothetical protein